MVQGAAVCKTVGSAYVGSNPTPATTCGNGPLAAETRPAGCFLLVTPCIRVCHCGSVCCSVHGRIADGVRAARTVGTHRRLFTDGHGQGPRGAHSGFACRAEPGACARTRVPRLAAPVCQEGCGGLRSDLLPGWRLVDRRIFGKFAGPGRLAPCGPSCRATGSVAARHANCRSAGGAARCGGRRAARGAYGRPCRIRALAGLPGRVTPMYLRRHDASRPFRFRRVPTCAGAFRDIEQTRSKHRTVRDRRRCQLSTTCASRYESSGPLRYPRAGAGLAVMTTGSQPGQGRFRSYAR